jgi:ATP-dependent RNA helicase DOB1
MSGRAGRRGKDDRGIVIQMLDEKMEPSVCKGILYGDPDPLNSSYRISYNMLLNMLRVEDVDPEYLLRASFHQFQREKDAPGLILQAEELEAKAAEMDLGPPEQAALIAQYYSMEKQLCLTRQKMMKIVRKPEYILKFLQAKGRFLDIVVEGEAFGWGVLVSLKSKAKSGAAGEAGRLASLSDGPAYSFEVLLPCVDRHFDTVEGKEKEEDASNNNVAWLGNVRQCRPVQPEMDEEKIISMRIFTVELDNIERISAVKLFVPADVRTPEARKNIAAAVKEVHRRFEDGIPLLDPIRDLKITEVEFKTLMERAEVLTERLSTHKVSNEFGEEDRLAKVSAFEKKEEMLESSRVLREEARACQTMALKDDLKKMKKVLKRLGHVDGKGVIQTKGRTACEINTANELVVVELIFAGVFNDLTVEQCVALLSCMTYDERNKDDDDPTKGLKGFLLNPFHKLQEVARSVAKSQIACKVDVDEDAFVDKFHPGM